jgi:hypothetical protein
MIYVIKSVTEAHYGLCVFYLLYYISGHGYTLIYDDIRAFYRLYRLSVTFTDKGVELVFDSLQLLLDQIGVRLAARY